MPLLQELKPEKSRNKPPAESFQKNMDPSQKQYAERRRRLTVKKETPQCPEVLSEGIYSSTATAISDSGALLPVNAEIS